MRTFDTLLIKYLITCLLAPAAVLLPQVITALIEQLDRDPDGHAILMETLGEL